MRFCPFAFVCAFALVSSLPAQPRVDFMNMHERIIAVVPVVGSGTYEDPKRPLFAPSGKDSVPGLISWSWQASDHGKLAIVEFVADSKEVLRPILADARVLKAFEKGKARLDDVEKELRKHRKDYSFGKGIPRRAR